MLTYETARTLLGVLDAERARHVRLLAVALDRHVPLFVELVVGAAEILAVRIGVGAAFEAAYRFGTCAITKYVLITSINFRDAENILEQSKRTAFGLL